jgi:hypothetical protein
MSCKDNPCSGYVVPVEDLIPALPHEHQARANELLADNDYEAMQELLTERLPAVLPRPEQVFVFGDEDTSDDLTSGGMYVEFAESDLYVKVEKPCLKAFLQAIGKKPEYCLWSMWG